MKYNADMLKWKRLIESLSATPTNEEEAPEHTDHEVSMAKSQLMTAVKSATRIAKHLVNISEEKGIDGWVASKITLAEDYLQTVANYMDGQDIRESEEMTDKTDTISMDVPLMIRIMEFAREDAKDDMALHSAVERMVEMSKSKSLSMEDYDAIVSDENSDISEAKGETLSSPQEAIEDAYDYLDTRHDKMDSVSILTKDDQEFVSRDSKNYNGISALEERGWKIVIIVNKDRTLRTTPKYRYLKTEE